MNVIALDHATLHIGGRAVLVDVSFAIEAGEFIGVLGPERRRQDHLDACDSRSAFAERRHASRCSAAARSAGNPAIGYLPQLRTVLPDLRVRGRDFIASSLNGERWGLPSLSRKERLAQSKQRSSPSARAILPRGRCPKCPAANGKGCCWRRR